MNHGKPDDLSGTQHQRDPDRPDAGSGRSGRYEIDTGCGFLNHMLELFARHGRFDLVLTCHGDVEVDYHHTTEDVASP